MKWKYQIVVMTKKRSLYESSARKEDNLIWVESNMQYKLTKIAEGERNKGKDRGCSMAK